jgi:YD repeat-containing protein
LEKTNPDETSSNFIYIDDPNDPDFLTMTAIDENNCKIKTTYNRLGYPKKIEDVTVENGFFTLSSYDYDNMSRLRFERDAEDTETEYQYDYLDRVTSKAISDTSNNLLYKETYSYIDAYSDLTISDVSRVEKTIQGEPGSLSIKTATYTNTHGFTARTSRWIDGVERSDNFTYDYLGNQLTATEAVDTGVTRVTSYEYDGAGRLTKTTNPDNSVYQATYDWLGRKTSATDPKGATSNNTYKSEYKYNALGLLIEEKLPFDETNSSTTTYTYDENGNLKTQQQTNHKPGAATPTESFTEYEYNNRNFLMEVKSYNKGTVDNSVIYTYDGVGNVTSMTTGAGTTVYEYDRHNRLEKMTDPEGMLEEYTYDENNNLKTKTDRNGNVTTNKYDLLNRVTEVSVTRKGTTAPVLGKTEYGYAITGLKVYEDNENLTITYVYDDAGRLITQTETSTNTPGASVVKNYTYDFQNNHKSFILTQGGVIRQNQSYIYDNMNRLTEVFDSGVLQATYSYDLNGNRESLVYANGTEIIYEYNLANLVISLINKKGSAILSSYEYDYYLDGNQASKTDHEGVYTAYTYDDLGRLIKETEQAPAGARGQIEEQALAKIYSFDTAGNRKDMTVAKAIGEDIEQYTVEYEYDANNRLLIERNIPFEAGPMFETEYEYDPNGNQISKQIIGTNDLETRTYDVFNRLRGVNSGSVNATYIYRPDGLRLSKTAAGQTTTHIWDGGNIVAELDGSGLITSRYVRGINLIKGVTAQGDRFYLQNAHGDVVQLVNALGVVQKDYWYDAFGNEIDEDPNDTNVWRYCGEYW